MPAAALGGFPPSIEATSAPAIGASPGPEVSIGSPRLGDVSADFFRRLVGRAAGSAGAVPGGATAAIPGEDVVMGTEGGPDAAGGGTSETGRGMGGAEPGPADGAAVDAGLEEAGAGAPVGRAVGARGIGGGAEADRVRGTALGRGGGGVWTSAGGATGSEAAEVAERAGAP